MRTWRRIIDLPFYDGAGGFGMLQSRLVLTDLCGSLDLFLNLLRVALTALEIQFNGSLLGRLELLLDYGDVGSLVFGSLEAIEVDVSERSPGGLAVWTRFCMLCFIESQISRVEVFLFLLNYFRRFLWMAIITTILFSFL